MVAIDHTQHLPVVKPRSGARAHMLKIVFASLPVWWLMGLFPFVWPIIGFFLLLALIRQGDVSFPRGFGLWLLLLAWAPLSLVQLGGDNANLLFAQRFATLGAATVLFLYLFNSSREDLPNGAILEVLTLFWAMLVVGGLISILFPTVSFHSPFELLLPAGLVANPFVHGLVHVEFAQVQTFLGYPVGRPSPFYSFTNAWGSAVALLTPIAFAAFIQTRSPLRRRLLGALLVLSVIPIVVSLNRGVWLALALALGYAALRFAHAQRMNALAGLIGLVGFLLILMFLTPLGGLLSDRLATPHSNLGREALYRESFERTKESPIVGYGGPIESQETTGPPVGTHSQFFFLAISYGVPAVGLFLAWFGLTFLRSGRSVSGPLFWAHVAILVLLMEAPYYLLEMHVPIAMMIAAYIWREVARAPARVPAHGRVARSATT
jgi:polysaccharide biosynthesis protein PslJ